MQNEIDDTHNKLLLAQRNHKRLLRELNSQDDPRWIELILMDKLGMAPKGCTKVYFEDHICP